MPLVPVKPSPALPGLMTGVSPVQALEGTPVYSSPAGATGRVSAIAATDAYSRAGIVGKRYGQR